MIKELKSKLVAILTLVMIASIQFSTGQEISNLNIIVKDTVYFDSTSKISLGSFLYQNNDSIHIIIKGGTYDIENAIWIKGSNIIIEGIGKVNIYCTSLQSNVMWLTGTNIHLKNLHLRHFKPDNLDAKSCSGRVLSFNGAKYVTIENCDLNGCGVSGLHDNGSNSNIFITGNHIHNNSLGAFTDHLGNVWVNTVDSHAIFHFSNNLIENNGHGRIIEPIDYDENFMENGIKLLYPYFSLQIDGFLFDEVEIIKHNEYFEYIFHGDSSIAYFHYDEDYTYPFGLLVKKDTLRISENPNNFIADKLITIIPKDSTDDFKISYAYEQIIYEVIDWRKTNRSEDFKPIRWIDFSNYHEIDDSLKFYFRLPAWWDYDYAEAVKEKYNLRDSSFVIPGEYSTQVEFTKDNKIFGYWIDKMYLRIDRIEKGEIRETKYIIIWQNEGD